MATISGEGLGEMFSGISSDEMVPDHATWHVFREQLVEKGR